MTLKSKYIKYNVKCFLEEEYQKYNANISQNIY